MTLKGPYITVAAGVLVAAVVFGLSVTAAGRDADRAARNAAAAVAQEETPPPTPQPSPAEPTPDRPPRTYAGQLPGLAASIAVAVNGKSAVAYVCDGKRVEAWYQGSTTDGTTYTFTDPTGATLSARLDRGALSGALRLAGRDLTFAVKPVEAPNGLFRAVEQAAAEAATVIGWILTPEGQVGIARRGNEVGPAPVLDPAKGTATVNGRTVRATAVTGSPIG